VKLGLLVEAEEGLDWARWRQVLLAAERLGFSSVWISDHLQSPWSAEPGSPAGLDAWVALAVAATQTRRLQLGSLVSPVTFRPPAVLARLAHTVEMLAPGRLVVGLGLGWNRAEHDAFGIPFPPPVQRAWLLGQTVQLLRQTLHAPVLIGGGGASTLPLVARYADYWNLTTAAVDTYTERATELARQCLEVERPSQEIRRSIAVGFLVGRDEAELRERARRLQRLVPPLAKVAHEAVPDAARGMGWIAGTPGELVHALEPLAKAGVELAILGHYDPDDVDALELIATRVMPALA
jgi:alkanesulfonate monooxygenase SsuD/methylene tetrahydromethanopterin reductase-like flavin-dependent oxidoreductase (luciferase family)